LARFRRLLTMSGTSTPSSTPRRRGKGKKTLRQAAFMMPPVVVSAPIVVASTPLPQPIIVSPPETTSSLTSDTLTPTETPRRRGKGRKNLRHADGTPISMSPVASSSSSPMPGEWTYGGMDSRRAIFDASLLHPPIVEREALKQKLNSEKRERFNANVLTIVGGCSSSSSTYVGFQDDFSSCAFYKRQKIVERNAEAEAAAEQLAADEKRDELARVILEWNNQNLMIVDRGSENWGLSNEDLYYKYKDTGVPTWDEDFEIQSD